MSIFDNIKKKDQTQTFLESNHELLDAANEYLLERAYSGARNYVCEHFEKFMENNDPYVTYENIVEFTTIYTFFLEQELKGFITSDMSREDKISVLSEYGNRIHGSKPTSSEIFNSTPEEVVKKFLISSVPDTGRFNMASRTSLPDETPVETVGKILSSSNTGISNRVTRTSLPNETPSPSGGVSNEQVRDLLNKFKEFTTNAEGEVRGAKIYKAGESYLKKLIQKASDGMRVNGETNPIVTGSKPGAIPTTGASSSAYGLGGINPYMAAGGALAAAGAAYGAKKLFDRKNANK